MSGCFSASSEDTKLTQQYSLAYGSVTAVSSSTLSPYSFSAFVATGSGVEIASTAPFISATGWSVVLYTANVTSPPSAEISTPAALRARFAVIASELAGAYSDDPALQSATDSIPESAR